MRVREDQAQETYDEMIKDDLTHLSAGQRSMIIAQKTMLKADHDHVKSLRDALIEA